jgi:predicted transposase/invertase (TIGR01784 family)
MRTDTIFYQLFLTFHSLLFELLGEPIENADGYQFISAEIKEKAFRFDGIFIPDQKDKPLYFVEVQFQNKPDFYWEFIAEINLYLNQYKPVQDWKAIALFAQRRFEVKSLSIFQQELINSGRIIPIYLDEVRSGSIGVGLIQLIIAQEAQTPILVQQLLQRARTEIADSSVARDIIDLLETVLVSKFAQLSREEIQAMFLLSDIKQTRVYQEAKQEGRQEGEVRLVLRLLSKRVGIISDRSIEIINSLTLEQLDDLGDALLDFGNIADLDNWLKSHVKE